jgi:hypothetical protein
MPVGSLAKGWEELLWGKRCDDYRQFLVDVGDGDIRL